MMLVVMLQLLQIMTDGGCALHGLQQLLTGQLIPRGNHQRCIGIVLTQQCDGRIQFRLCNGICARENDGRSSFDLVVVEFAEVFHIDLDLACIGNCNLVAQNNIVIEHLFNSGHHIGQFANAGRFNYNAVGMVLLNDLGQCLAEVAHQRAANTAGVHLGNVDTCILQESAIDTDFAEFVFDQDQFFALVGFLNHLFDEGGLTGTQEAGINVNFRHNVPPKVFIDTCIIPPLAPHFYPFFKKRTPQCEALKCSYQIT